MKKTERKTRRTTSKEAVAPKAEASKPRANVNQSEELGLSEIKQLIELISDKQFNEFELERGSFRLRLIKGPGKTASAQSFAATAAVAEPVAVIAQQTPASPPPAAQAVVPAVPEENLHVINSPIVGTFYRSPSPTADAFVKIGDAIEEGKVLCIIEAMKLMNEIQSDTSGIVAKIFVENGQPVEFGQPLFGIKK